MCHGEPLYWFRQSFVVLSISIQSLSNGMMLAFPSVLNPAILDPDTKDIKATPNQASWFASVVGITGLLGFLTLSPIMQVYGRKTVHIAKNVIMATAWIIFYKSASLPVLFLARLVQGVGIGGIFINVIMIGEFVHPSRRGYFSTIQKFAISVGTFICHVMGIWFNWRQIAAVAIAMPTTALFLTFFWTESPFFLAMRGRYDECERSFHYLNGTLSRNAELQDLIAEQKKRREGKTYTGKIKKNYKQMLSPDFRKSFAIGAIMMISIDFSGRNYFKAYVVQIMMDLLGDKTIAIYISVGSDVSVLTALLISCFIVKYFKRRSLLFSFGVATVIIYFFITIILYLKSNNIVHVWSWLVPSLVLFNYFIIHIGYSPICFIVIGEIFPLNSKGLGCCLCGMVFTSSYGATLKLTPVLMENVGLGGMYIIYASGLTLCLVALYYILPETKDRTLLEIEKDLIIVKDLHTTESLLKPM